MDTATTASQINLMEMAKQGELNALAALMNRSLKAHGIFAELSLTKGCLVVSAMFDQTAPNKANLVEMLKRGIGNIRPKGVQRVMVQAMSIRDRAVAWQSAFILPKADATAGSPLTAIAAKVSGLARGSESGPDTAIQASPQTAANTPATAAATTAANSASQPRAIAPTSTAATHAAASSSTSPHAVSTPALTATASALAQPPATAGSVEPNPTSLRSLPKQAIGGYILLAIGLIMMLTGLGQSIQGIQAASSEEKANESDRTAALLNKAIHAQAGGAMMIAGAVLVGSARQRD